MKRRFRCLQECLIMYNYGGGMGMREISMNSMEEFIRDVAYDCVDNMSDKNKN